LPVNPIDGVVNLQGDFLERKTTEQIIKIFNNNKIDLILSDLSPNLSGISISDSTRINHLGELVLEFCKEYLSTSGAVLLKTFHGSGYSQLVEKYKRVFCQVLRKKPESSRSESAEVFILAKNLKSKVV
jgi:23S rRNA (uridine2552-2'-O)-methyltransferase